METATTTGPLTAARLVLMLVFGFFLLLFGANPDAAFAEWVSHTLTRVLAPFRGVLEPAPLDGRSVVDVSILFAMVIYALAALLLHALADWLTDRIAEADAR